MLNYYYYAMFYKVFSQADFLMSEKYAKKCISYLGINNTDYVVYPFAAAFPITSSHIEVKC